MALQLPAKFLQDIQGTNTNLIPIVIIDPDGLNIKISTTSLTFDGDYYKPLLLSLPKLSESIDIVKRKYKISSINLSLSNYIYDGERLSETIVDTAFVNKDASVYWITESAETMDDAFLVYKGITRKYNHDDEKISFTIEDQTQKLLHKDLPSATIQTEKGYKYIPLVYGRKKNVAVFMDKDIIYLETNEDCGLLQPLYDENDEINIVNDEIFKFPTSSLKVFSDGYTMLLPQFIHLMDYTDHPYSKYTEITTPEAVMNLEGVEVGTQQFDLLVNHTNYLSIKPTAISANNILQGITYGKPNISFQFGFVGSSSETNLRDTLTHPYEIADMFGFTTIEVNNIEFLTDGNYDDTIFEQRFVVDHYSPNQWEDNQSARIMMTMDCQPTGDFIQTYLLAVAVDKKHLQYEKDHKPFACAISNFGGQTTQWSGFYDGVYSMNKELLDNIIFYNPINTHDFWYALDTNGDGELDQDSGWTLGFDPANNRTDRVYIAPNMTPEEYIWVNKSIPTAYSGGATNYVDFSISGDSNSFIQLIPAWTDMHYSYSNNYIVLLQQHDLSMKASNTATLNIWHMFDKNYDHPTDPNDFGLEDTEVTFKAKQVDYASVVDVDKYKAKYFADIKGRLTTTDDNPTVPEIIGDLLANELDFSGNIEEPIDNYGFKYAFGLSKKLNSKNLIEQLSSASPFIPRFSPNGDFKFSVIPKELSEMDVDHEIFERDIIDFKYSRTPLEQVYEKVEFYYNFDDGFETFQSRVSINITDIDALNNWSKEYYGFNNNTVNTLTIDDNRGKYITTWAWAYKFAVWQLSLNCNQHLLVNIVLPLHTGLGIEVGDIVSFDKLIGDVNPYMIGENGTYEGEVNGQRVYNRFLVTKTDKTLDKVTVSLYQLHNLFTVITDAPDEEVGSAEEELDYLIGDTNNDGGFNVLDIITLANCILSGTCENLEHPEVGDTNGDGGYNVLDIITLANCILSGTCEEI